MTPQSLAEAVTQRLARWADSVELGDRTAFWTLFELLTRESLTYDGDPRVPPFSGICNDGTPWQFCVSLGASAPQIRYLTEVGRHGAEMNERVALTRARLVEAFARFAYPEEATSLLDELLALLPTDPQKLGGFRSGVWVGVAQGSDGIPRIRVYVNAGWGTELDRWTRISRCIERIGGAGFAEALTDLVPLLVSSFVPAGLAATLPGSPVVLKLYLRPKADPLPECLELFERAIGPAAREVVVHVWEALSVPSGQRSQRAALLSVAGAVDGSELDVKLDFCGHCLFHESLVATSDRVRDLTRRLGLDPAPYEHALSAMEMHGSIGAADPHALVGVGIDSHRRPRMNIYMTTPRRASTHSGRRSDAHTLEPGARSALEKAVHWLTLAAEGPRWTDYRLPVGISTTWVTAYVGAAFAESVAVGASSNARAGLVVGAKYLHEVVRDDGWGYNEAVECDADSTSLAILALRAAGQTPPAAKTMLSGFADGRGGYSTFRRSDATNAWGHPHADVLPSAITAALATRSLADPTLAALSILELREADGSWHSYWWATDLYATAVSVRCLARLGRGSDLSHSLPWLLEQRPTRAFECALLVRALMTPGLGEAAVAAASAFVGDLVAQQEPNGSWRPTAWLRVTHESVAEPWLAPDSSGALFLDRGVFTTATCIQALAEFLRRAA